MGIQTKHILFIAPVISNRPDKILYTDKQIDEFYQIAGKFMNSSISIDEAILQLRGGEKFKDFSFIVLYIWLYRLQNNHVQGFQTIHLPHQEWMPKGANQRPLYVGGYGSFNPRTSLSLANINHRFEKLSQIEIKKAYSQISNLSVKGKNWQVTAWSVAKHVHHGPDFGLDPTDYGMSQGDLNNIAKKGLINHIWDGETVLLADYVKVLQKRWKKFAEHRNVRERGIETVMGEQCYVVKHDRTRIFLSFKVNSRKSYTGYRLNPDQSLDHDKNGIIGKNYKN